MIGIVLFCLAVLYWCWHYNQRSADKSCIRSQQNAINAQNQMIIRMGRECALQDQAILTGDTYIKKLEEERDRIMEIIKVMTPPKDDDHFPASIIMFRKIEQAREVIAKSGNEQLALEIMEILK